MVTLVCREKCSCAFFFTAYLLGNFTLIECHSAPAVLWGFGSADSIVSKPFLTGAQCSEVLSGLWYNIGSQLHYNASGCSATNFDVKEALWFCHPAQTTNNRCKFKENGCCWLWQRRFNGVGCRSDAAGDNAALVSGIVLSSATAVYTG